MTPDLRNYTMARVALGRTGNAPTLRETLAFQLSHARARDAVRHPFNAAAVAAEVNGIILHSAAKDRTEYLRRPDLGRRLRVHAPPAAFPPQHPSVVFILADGLSPIAVERHAPALLRTVTPLLPDWTLAKSVIVEQGRVGIGDEIGQLLNADAAVVLIGERPGLSSPDSLGVYLTWSPRPGRTDAERNCISNIRPEGLAIGPAAELLALLLNSARQLGLSGVKLKVRASLVS